MPSKSISVLGYYSLSFCICQTILKVLICANCTKITNKLQKLQGCNRFLLDFRWIFLCKYTKKRPLKREVWCLTVEKSNNLWRAIEKKIYKYNMMWYYKQGNFSHLQIFPKASHFILFKYMWRAKKLFPSIAVCDFNERPLYIICIYVVFRGT